MNCVVRILKLALKSMVGLSFLDYWLLNHHSDVGRATQPIFRVHPSTNVNCVCFPRAYIIIPFDLTNAISLFTLLWKIHPLGILMNCRWVHQLPPYPFIGLMMSSCFGTRFHSTFPENLATPSRQIVLHPFLLKHPKSEVSWHQSEPKLGQIWWLEHISKSYNIGLYMTW